MLNKKLFLAKECEQLDQDYGGDQEEDAGHEGGEGQRLWQVKSIKYFPVNFYHTDQDKSILSSISAYRVSYKT